MLLCLLLLSITITIKKQFAIITITIIIISLYALGVQEYLKYHAELAKSSDSIYQYLNFDQVGARVGIYHPELRGVGWEKGF